MFQMARVDVDAKTEQKIGKLFANTGREIGIAVDILNKIIEKKMELGLLSREPTRHEVAGVIGTADLNAVAGYDDKTRAKMGLLAGKLLGTIAKLVEEKPVQTIDITDESEEVG